MYKRQCFNSFPGNDKLYELVSAQKAVNWEWTEECRLKLRSEKQLQEIVNAVGDKIEVILDGGIRRGTHVLKALSLGAKACSMGKAYLYALSAGGQIGVEMLLTKMKSEIERDMTLMGCRSVRELNKNKIAFR
mgnify:CR=1 FL=1